MSPLAMMEQMAWDASVLSISRSETDADELPIARVAVTTEQSRLSSSTGVDADMPASTQALEDDGDVPARVGSSDIVRSGPRAEPPLAVPVSEAMVPIVAVNVAAESKEQGGTQQRRVRTLVVWGQGIPLRPAMTIRRPTSAVPDRAAVVPTNQCIATPPDSTSRTLLPLGLEAPTSSALGSHGRQLQECP